MTHWSFCSIQFFFFLRRCTGINPVGSVTGSSRCAHTSAAAVTPLAHAPCTLEESRLLSCTASPANHTLSSRLLSSARTPAQKMGRR